MNCKTGTLKDPSFACACENCFEGMRLSDTLNRIGDKTNQKHHEAMLRMLEVSRTLNFDLDDFMFEIWKDTLDDY